MNQINAFDVFKTFLIDPSTYTNHFKIFISSPNNLFHIIEKWNSQKLQFEMFEKKYLLHDIPKKYPSFQKK